MRGNGGDTINPLPCYMPRCRGVMSLSGCDEGATTVAKSPLWLGSRCCHPELPGNGGLMPE